MAKRIPIRWTVGKAALEVGISRDTMRKRLQESGALPGPDRKYSVKQAVDAAMRTVDAERIKKLRAERALSELELAHRQNELVRVDQLEDFLSSRFDALRKVIKGSKLSNSEQSAMLRELRHVRAAELQNRK